MRGTWSTSRCAGPDHTRGGWTRCVLNADRCRDHGPFWRLRPVRLVAAVVWRLKPWWPNAVGRAQDRGEYHTCPLVYPCRACVRETADGRTRPGR